MLRFIVDAQVARQIRVWEAGCALRCYPTSPLMFRDRRDLPIAKTGHATAPIATPAMCGSLKLRTQLCSTDVRVGSGRKSNFRCTFAIVHNL